LDDFHTSKHLDMCAKYMFDATNINTHRLIRGRCRKNAMPGDTSTNIHVDAIGLVTSLAHSGVGPHGHDDIIIRKIPKEL
jgi:hypothetical protein